jgi:hypothetical protein
MYYHRVGGKKETIENEKVYAIKDANQVKSVFNVGKFGIDKGGYDNTKTGFAPVEKGPGYVERIQEKKTLCSWIRRRGRLVASEIQLIQRATGTSSWFRRQRSVPIGSRKL